jgi:hypothetical protein
MRTCIVISVIVHAAIMLWLVLAPAARTLGPASAEPILVDLLPPRDAEREPPKSEPPQNGNSSTAAADSAEERAATAARLAWMLNLPVDTVASLAAPPSESKSNLAPAEIAEFKAQVSKCWVVPAGVPSTPGFDVLIRIALNPDGKLGTAPELIRAPASNAGPPLVESAKRALRQCQPYGTLPADRYLDWKILELSFTAQGPSGLFAPPARNRSAR